MLRIVGSLCGVSGQVRGLVLSLPFSRLACLLSHFPLVFLFLLLWPGLDLRGRQEHSEHPAQKNARPGDCVQTRRELKDDTRPREPSMEALLSRPEGRLPFHMGKESRGDVCWEARRRPWQLRSGSSWLSPRGPWLQTEAQGTAVLPLQ